MTALPERRRKRTIAMVLTTVAVMIIGPLLGYVGVRAVLDSTAGKDATAGNLPVAEFPFTPAAALFTTDEGGVLAGITMFVLSPTGSGGSIVPITVNSDVGFDDAARRSVRTVFAEEGPEAAVFAVESLLLVSVEYSAVEGPSELTSMLAAHEPYQVTLASPVVAEQDADSIEAGAAVLDAATAARVLTSGVGTVSEDARIANAEAVWAGYAAAVGSGAPASVAAMGVPVDFDDLVARVGSGPVGSRGIAHVPFEAKNNPGGLDVSNLDRADAVFVFASIAPGSMSAPNQGPIIRVEAPAGYDAQVRKTIAILLFIQGNVVSVTTGAPPQAGTVWLVPDEADLLRIPTDDQIFGQVSFGEPTVRYDGVDATLVLGTDYLESVQL